MAGNDLKADIAGTRAVGMKVVLVDPADPHGKEDTIKSRASLQDLLGVMEYLRSIGPLR